MKCLERLVLDYIKKQIPLSFDPWQFAYRKSRSVEDAISIALHSVYQHLDKRHSCIRMLFIDYSSAFNTLIPSLLIPKLQGLGLCDSICEWIFSFLISRPQRVKIGNVLSDTLILSTGSPQGCILSSFLFTLFTYLFNLTVKYADDTTIIGLIKKR